MVAVLKDFKFIYLPLITRCHKAQLSHWNAYIYSRLMLDTRHVFLMICPDFYAFAQAIDPQPMSEEQFMLPPQALETDTAEQVPSASKAVETDSADSLPSLDLSLKPDVESMEATPTEPVQDTQEHFTVTTEIPLVYPQFIPAYIPIPFPLWPPNAVALDEDRSAETSHHQILKPIPVVPKEPVNVDELVGMSQLSLGETGSGQKDPLPLSLKLTGESSRQSAFHGRTPDNSSEMTKGETTPIQAL